MFQVAFVKASHDCSSLENVPHTGQGNARIVQDIDIFGCELKVASGDATLFMTIVSLQTTSESHDCEVF